MHWNSFLHHFVSVNKMLKRNDASDIFNEQNKQNNIQIRFDKSVRFRLIEEYGLNCYEENENGLLLSLDYTNKDYVFNWAWGSGTKPRFYLL